MPIPFALTRSRCLFAALAIIVAVLVGTPVDALAQDGYVTLRSVNQALAYDPANPTDVTNTVSLPGAPTGIAMSPDGTTAYVVVGAALYRIVNGVLNATALVANLGVLPEQITVSPDGATLFVTDASSASGVRVVDVASGKVTDSTFPSNSGVWGIDAVTTAAGDRVYVSMSNTDQVAVLDMAGTTLSTLGVGDTPRGVAASPLGDRVYVANDIDGSLTVIDTATETSYAIAGIGNNPEGVTVSADGSLVYVTLRGDGDVVVIDPFANAVVDTIDLGSSGDKLHGISFDADGNFVVVAHFGNRRVSVIDPADGNSFVTIGPIGTSQPRYVAYTPLAPIFPRDPDLPPAFNLPLCDSSFDADVGEELAIALSVLDDHGALVTLSESPATGGEMVPALPAGLVTPVESTFRWTPTGDDAGDYALTFIADDGINAPVSCAVTVHVPEPPPPPEPDETEFAAYRLNVAKISTRGRFADSFWFNGNFTVDLDNGDDIAPDAEEVTIAIEGSEWIIPAGEFRKQLRGRLFRFRGTVGGTKLLVHITRLGRPQDGRYQINVTGWNADFADPDNPLEMCVTVGNDFGCDQRRGWVR